jgi:hypothetical protein
MCDDDLYNEQIYLIHQVGESALSAAGSTRSRRWSRLMGSSCRSHGPVRMYKYAEYITTAAAWSFQVRPPSRGARQVPSGVMSRLVDQVPGRERRAAVRGDPGAHEGGGEGAPARDRGARVPPGPRTHAADAEPGELEDFARRLLLVRRCCSARTSSRCRSCSATPTRRSPSVFAAFGRPSPTASYT